VQVPVNNAGFAVADFAEDIQFDELRLELKRISLPPLR